MCHLCLGLHTSKQQISVIGMDRSYWRLLLVLVVLAGLLGLVGQVLNRADHRSGKPVGTASAPGARPSPPKGEPDTETQDEKSSSRPLLDKPTPIARPAHLGERRSQGSRAPPGALAFRIVDDEAEELVWDDVKRIVQTKMEDEVLPEIEDCIQAWQEADPMVEGEVKLGFTLGNYGLDTVEILDASRDIPGGPRTPCVMFPCMSAIFLAAHGHHL